MKKKSRKENNRNEEVWQLNERLNEEVLAKLKSASKKLKEAEKAKAEERIELEKQRRLEKEKNKTFEQLLDESSLDWKSFK